MRKKSNLERVSLNKDTNPETHKAVCNICGNERKMSGDHVPLKSLGNKGRVSVKSHHVRFPIKGLTLQNGIVFRTICAECNNKLGSLYDPYYLKFCSDISKFADIVLKKQVMLPSFSIEIDTIPSNVSRSLIGHILATKIHYEGPFVEELREYINNPAHVLPDTIHLYTWFYAGSRIKVLPENVIIKYAEPIELYIYYVIKSYPCAFVLTNHSFPSMGLIDLMRYENGKEAKIGLSLLYHPHPEWPECNFIADNSQGVIIDANNLYSIET